MVSSVIPAEAGIQVLSTGFRLALVMASVAGMT